MEPIGVLTNPHSGGGRRGSRRAALERAMQHAGIVRETSTPEQIDAVIDEFTAAGCRFWVCDGGDGTLHWLLTRLHELGRVGATDGPVIVLGNGGSIDFLAKKLGVRGTSPEIVGRLRERIASSDRPETIELDTLHLTGARQDGGTFDRIGFATAIAGVAQRFFIKLYEYRPVRPLTIARVLAEGCAGAILDATGPFGRWSPDYLHEYARELFGRDRAEVRVDGRLLPFRDITSLQIGAVDIDLGGVVRTFRKAKSSGAMHVQAVGLSPLAIVANVPNILLGTPIRGRDVIDDQASEVAVTALGDTILDPVIDGERFFGLREVAVRLGPPVRFAIA